MAEGLETVVAKIDRLPNSTNVLLMKEYHAFLKINDTSERHQMNSIPSSGFLTADGMTELAVVPISDSADKISRTKLF